MDAERFLQLLSFCYRANSRTTASVRKKRSASLVFRMVSKSDTPRTALKMAVMPMSYKASDPRPTEPQSATQGTLALRHRAATVPGTLPEALCQSMRPSPVKTMSACSKSVSKPALSKSSSAPGTSCPPNSATTAAPIPPAAPAPGS